jgi:hypothetical protein
MPRAMSAATAMIGIMTAIAVLPAGERPELCDACLVGPSAPEVVLEGVTEVCWFPLDDGDEVTTTVVGGSDVPWLGV